MLQINQFNLKMHLVNRAGFGISPASVADEFALNYDDLLNQLFLKSENFVPINIIPEHEFANYSHWQRGNDKVQNRRSFRKANMKIGNQWLHEMAFGEAQLRERMAFFWHDHFACKSFFPSLWQKQLNMLRENALGFFGDLVYNIAHDPAMINYLNIRKNVKGQANEDFGRELLELFTVGVGKYSEKDVKEVARAFTGWRFKVSDGSFFIDEKRHDDGLKTFFGFTDYFNGDDILNIIFQREDSGEYIVGKIYHYLTGLEIEPAYLKVLSKSFYKSKYHIGRLVKKILSEDQFKISINQRVKSPIDLIAGLMRFTGIRFEDADFSYRIQSRLGQILGEPPNVSGWISGTQWLDLGSLAERINLCGELLLKAKLTNKITLNSDPELTVNHKTKFIKISHSLQDLKLLFDQFDEFSPAEQLIQLMLGTTFSNSDQLIQFYEKKPLKENMMSLKRAIIRIAALPEYQLN